jgi:hypothetical protein
MNHMEDLSKIIREKEVDIDKKHTKIIDFDDINKDLKLKAEDLKHAQGGI